eukprot:CAMPEP_0206317610 /NCGR_PEP_ID=MMETSP0106_2-20121207/16727_1 /ASSEMBLY_ACC=CAM_ASM_000206 /TAXON_ID=81532 /ORGANISM="Acanthoeca-like sp., Strain 10tr" /LENGTH=428 /DNA_ID=CAMNT_0053749213 /DNA_START=11 /DNA_END=1294 /DNA_ORIENTATION=-
MALRMALTAVQRTSLAAPPRVVPAVAATQKRHLNLHEYQCKNLLRDAGLNVQQFEVATTADEAAQIAERMGVKENVVKAMVLAGGRGKGTFSNGFQGGVHVLDSDPAKVKGLAENMLGFNLVTKQTTADGVPVHKLMIAESLDIDHETYFAIVLDRESNGPVMVGSPEGGMDIEEVAEENPDAILKIPIDVNTGVTDAQATEMAAFLKFTNGDEPQVAADQIKKMYDLFAKVDAVQVEINPFANTKDGRVVCFDAKIGFDDNASFRQKEIFAQEDTAESDPREVEAASIGLNYVGMDGNIGCLVNGAGLAMGTMDIIKLYGGEPANFLDCGGGVTPEGVASAFKIITKDPKVKAILVNIFGGIVNCATVANGIVAACKEISLELPLVVRLEGTNVEEARSILDNSGLPIISAADLDDAAQKAVATLEP